MTQKDAALFFSILAEVAFVKNFPFEPAHIPSYLDVIGPIPLLQCLEALHTHLKTHLSVPTPQQLIDAMNLNVSNTTQRSSNVH